MASQRQEVFMARVAELGLEDAIPKLKTKGLTTYAKYAFGCDYNPQMPDPSILTNQLLEPVADGKEDMVPLLRMLWWEAWGLAAADMRRQTEPDADTPRKLTPPELNNRRRDVEERLVGVALTQELDISDALLTECVGMYDVNRLSYLPWDRCTARNMEVIGGQADRRLDP